MCVRYLVYHHTPNRIARANNELLLLVAFVFFFRVSVFIFSFIGGSGGDGYQRKFRAAFNAKRREKKLQIICIYKHKLYTDRHTHTHTTQHVDEQLWDK